MRNTKTLTDYDNQAAEFDRQREPGEAVIAFLRGVLPLGERCLSIGCGTGQYEEVLESPRLIGLDKSRGMLALATERVRWLLQGDMLYLPVKQACVDGVYIVNSLHHLGANLDISEEDRTAARLSVLSEIHRTLRLGGRVAIVQRDPEQNKAVWFWQYFPRALATKLRIQPPVTRIREWLRDTGFREIQATPLHDPMIKGFFTEEAPMSDEFRYSFSEFSYLTAHELETGLANLRLAIQNGTARAEIQACKERFAALGGTVYGVSARK